MNIGIHSSLSCSHPPAGDLGSTTVEDRIALKLNKVARGQYQLEPGGPLAAGEYALVLREIGKRKNNSDHMFGARSGVMGGISYSVWDFAVR